MSTDDSSTTTAPTPTRPRRQAHVRPEDVGKIGGAQTVDDKVETWHRQLEAQESQPDSGGDNVWYWGALILSFVVGSSMSGFSLSGGSSTDVFFGAVDLVTQFAGVVG